MAIERGIERKLEKIDDTNLWDITHVARKTTYAELAEVRQRLVDQRDKAQNQVLICNNQIAMIDDFVDNALTEKTLKQDWTDVDSQAKQEAEAELTTIKNDLA